MGMTAMANLTYINVDHQARRGWVEAGIPRPLAWVPPQCLVDATVLPQRLVDVTLGAAMLLLQTVLPLCLVDVTVGAAMVLPQWVLAQCLVDVTVGAAMLLLQAVLPHSAGLVGQLVVTGHRPPAPNQAGPRAASCCLELAIMHRHNPPCFPRPPARPPSPPTLPQAIVRLDLVQTGSSRFFNFFDTDGSATQVGGAGGAGGAGRGGTGRGLFGWITPWIILS